MSADVLRQRWRGDDERKARLIRAITGTATTDRQTTDEPIKSTYTQEPRRQDCEG